MCGLGFISPAPGSDLPVRAMSRWMLHQLASRGRDAAGVAWKRPDGSTLYRKLPGHPVRLAAHLAAVSGSRSLDKSEAVILHTRWSTIGNPEDNDNNHPVVRPGVAMVHNGSIRNAKQLYKLAGSGQRAAVDSDAIAALIETAYEPDELFDRFTRIDGLAAIAWLEVTNRKADRDALWAARIDTRPLVIGETPAGDLLGASTMEALLMAASHADVTLTTMEELPEGTVIQVKGGRVIERWEIETGSGMVETTAEYDADGLAV